MKKMIFMVFLLSVFSVASHGSGCGGSQWEVVSEVIQGSVPIEMDIFGGRKVRSANYGGWIYGTQFWNIAIGGNEVYFRSEGFSAQDLNPADVENELLKLPNNFKAEKVLQTLRVVYDDCDDENVGKERFEYNFNFSLIVDGQSLKFTTSRY